MLRVPREMRLRIASEKIEGSLDSPGDRRGSLGQRQGGALSRRQGGALSDAGRGSLGQYPSLSFYSLTVYFFLAGEWMEREREESGARRGRGAGAGRGEVGGRDRV